VVQLLVEEDREYASSRPGGTELGWALLVELVIVEALQRGGNRSLALDQVLDRIER
jgi:hypothetical protein